MAGVLTTVGYLVGFVLVVVGVAWFSPRVALVAAGLAVGGLTFLHDPDRSAKR